jgi:hypothetical protein
MAIGTATRIAGLVAISTLAATAALSSTPQLADQLAEATAAEETMATIEIVAPKTGGGVGTISFGVTYEKRDDSLPFGGPR